MKKIGLYLLGIAIFCIGCEDLKFGENFLDKPLGTTVTLDTVYSNRKFAEQALNNVYITLPDFMPNMGSHPNAICLDAYTDLGFNPNAYVAGTLSSSYTSAFPFRLDHSENFGNPLVGIRRAYSYIENVDRVPDMTDSEKSKRKAEAKAIIGFHYVYMLRYYGGLPWIDHSYKPDDSFQFVRLSLAETVEKICGLLDEAANELPWSVADEDFGRLTAAACKAAKFRLLLFVASPLFNNNEPYATGEAADLRITWFGDENKQRWEDALKAGREFMRMNAEHANYYQMINTGNPREDFVNGYFTKGTREVILSSHRYAVYNKGVKTFHRAFGITSQAPRASYADMYQWHTGEEFDWDNPEHRAHPFFDAEGNPTRDIRLYETLLVNEDKYQNRKAEAYMNGREGPNSKDGSFGMSGLYGYAPRKFLRDKLNEMHNKPYQCPLIRMPEIYLSLSEAMNELGKAKEVDEFGYDAYDYIALVRDRAGMVGLDRGKVLPGNNLREAILCERAKEFGYEECRYFDLIRWKHGEDWFTAPVEKLETTINEEGSFTYKRYAEKDLCYKWESHWYLLPFSLSEIQKKYGLVQNPGW